ncbi:MAG: hypothetical protein HJJLKODD_01796 [Phycisphaerae bacterium]|nr:hypothetical protein [Phycisphaerae bacterium]
MKNMYTIVSALVLLLIFGFYMCTYQVRFTDVAVLKTFGKFSDEDIIRGDEKGGAGLKFKLPWPIQEKVITDLRLRILQDSYEEFQTQDSKNILVSTYVCWKVDDPKLFHNASETEKEATSKLATLVRDIKKNVIGQHPFSQLVNINPSEFQFTRIEAEMKDQITSKAQTLYGIKVVDLGIRKLGLPQSISENVFERMKKAEEQTATSYRAEGEAQARDIRAEASTISRNIMAVATRLAGEIQAEAAKEEAEYYKVFEQAPELQMFLLQLDSAKQVLKERTTLVLDSAVAPGGLIRLDYLLGQENMPRLNGQPASTGNGSSQNGSTEN